MAATSKKRKVSADQVGSGAPTKKRSPLLNQPQNYYAPENLSSMTKEELAAWRKDQRKKRNRESAAASRNKTRIRIEELEGELSKWKSIYTDMKARMQCMERHIQVLTQMNMKNGNIPQAHDPRAQAQSPSPTMVSEPDSPPRSPQHQAIPSPVIPNAVPSSMLPPPPAYSSIFPSAANKTSNPFPPLLSEPKDCNLVEKQELAAASSALTDMKSAKEESGEHIISISRQAVKITGAHPDSSKDLLRDTDKKQQQPSALPLSDPKVTGKGDGEEISGAGISEGSPDNVVSVGEASEVKEYQKNPVSDLDEGNSDAPSSLGSVTSDSSDADSSDDDEAYLDILVDSLDGDYDPELLI